MKHNILVPLTENLLVCLDDVHLQNEYINFINNFNHELRETNALGVMRQIFQLKGAYTFDEMKFQHIGNTSFLLTCSPNKHIGRLHSLK